MTSYHTLIQRIKRKPVQAARHVVQAGFTLFMLYVGWQFYRFYLHFESMGIEPYVERPAAVEGFLPISALVAVKAWISTGYFDMIHPAGLVLLLFFVTSGIFLKKTFCSWMCPVGTISEGLGRLSQKLFRKTFEPPKWLQYVLYPLKYLLLLFFIKGILIDMPGFVALQFLDSPYNRVSDVKMMLFFIDMSRTALKIILVLILLSMFVKNFWCRFLCPYGAMIGLGSLFRITGIKREPSSCINCDNCTRVCPQGIKVSDQGCVFTPECTACMQCVEACPIPSTLEMTIARKKVNKWVAPAVFFTAFFGVVGLAKLLGIWETAMTYEEFRELVPFAKEIGH
ncbi:4Fe-4S binding protein [Effusibacillus lacus]|uniref:4Fe-4S ferredoxin n=1 Tax=Effusibacillus lacus TaxID=1348429 RepID=A0A292YHH3_9BACL|nr:4Fe-4S binding protein [Effusibacillus lacus]TCS72035.1 4Fe-4S binding protein [Effusibacillus lacus]GAX90327.1 4Fe-4S ferredoxin [Effusibacillus lacus]